MIEEPQQDAGDAPSEETGDVPEPEAPRPGPDPAAEGPSAEGAPTEEELRARLEEELRKVRVQDLLLQSVASLVNLTARRIAKEDERDLEQGRVGIEAIRALVPLLDPEPGAQVKNALSELQMLYAQATGGPAQPAAGESEPAKPKGPGLWTPPGAGSS